MAKSSIDIVISTILKKTGIDAARAAFKNLASTVGKNLTNIKSGLDLATSAIRTFVSAMSRGMEFERMTTQFKSLTGSMELARQHMKDLQDLGRTPPFSLEQFAAASQAMLKMTGGMAGFKEQMKIVGDMAAATGNDIATVGRAFGLAYQVIRDGQDFGRAGQQLYSLGLMTKAQVAEFAELSKAGNDNRAVWEKLQEVFSRYDGAMAETEKTTKGLVEAIQGEATVAMTDFSSAISDAAKPALEGLLGYLKRINEDGTLEVWAEDCVAAMSRAGNAFAEATEKIKNFFGVGERNKQGSLMAALGGIGAGLSEGGNYGGGWRGFRKAQAAYLATHAENERIAQSNADRLNKMMREDGEWNEDIDIRKEAAKADDDSDRRAERRAAKAKKRAEESARAEAEARRRIDEDFARAEEKRAEEKRKKDLEEYAKSGSTDTFDRWLEAKNKADAEKLKKDKEAYAEFQRKSGVNVGASASDVGEFDKDFVAWREVENKKRAEEQKTTDAKKAAEAQAEADLHRQRLDNIKDEIKAKETAAKSAESVAQNAQTEFDRAFAMYRSEDKGAAQIAEERDYAADYKQLQKDANRYGGKWRIDELSRLMEAGDTRGQAAKLEEWRKSSRFTPEIESMVRAAAADQTRTTAEDELRQINANTKDLASKLDELLQVKG